MAVVNEQYTIAYVVFIFSSSSSWEFQYQMKVGKKAIQLLQYKRPHF